MDEISAAALIVALLFLLILHWEIHRECKAILRQARTCLDLARKTDDAAFEKILQWAEAERTADTEEASDASV